MTAAGAAITIAKTDVGQLVACGDCGWWHHTPARVRSIADSIAAQHQARCPGPDVLWPSPVCRGCGCTTDHPCPAGCERTDTGMCSRCAPGQGATGA